MLTERFCEIRTSVILPGGPERTLRDSGSRRQAIFSSVVRRPSRSVRSLPRDGAIEKLISACSSLEETSLGKKVRPEVHMKIYVGNSEREVIAENVKIGDPLTLSIAIEPNREYEFFRNSFPAFVYRRSCWSID